MSPPNINPFQLLEINIISAQDLAPVTKTMRTYAIAWVHPERKLATRIDEHGRTNPTWNDKFVFRVDEAFLNSDTSAIMIEIFSSTWLRDVQIGTVRVLIGNLFPNTTPTHQNNNPGMRFVALQIRRPSGRPQGILNMGVSLLNGTMRSMPLYKDLSSSAVGFHDLMDDKNDDHPQSQNDSKIYLRRTQSEKSDPTCYGGGGGGGSTILNGSVITGSEIGGQGKGSMVSDVGPSASVVAAAIAKGLYPNPVAPTLAVAGGGGGSEVGSSILEDWTVEDASVEGLKTKIGRWRTELPPIYDYGSEQQKQTPSTGKRRHMRRRTEGDATTGGKLFSCFGNAYGCEFTIVCGANSAAAQKKRLAGGKVHVSPSDNSNSR